MLVASQHDALNETSTSTLRARQDGSGAHGQRCPKIVHRLKGRLFEGRKAANAGAEEAGEEGGGLILAILSTGAIPLAAEENTVSL